jgi:hypothetical protein
MNFEWRTKELPQTPDSIMDLNFRHSFIKFIDEALNNFKGVMIISTTNQCRSIIIAQTYLMTKYKWNASKTLEYLAIKKPDLLITTEILAAFQMIAKEL